MNSEEAATLITGILENNYPINTVIRTGAIEYGTSDKSIMKMYEQVSSYVNSRDDVDFVDPDVKVV